MTSKTKLLRSKTELPWNRLLDKNLLFLFIYSNAFLLACHISWRVVAIECVYVYRRRERVSFPPVNTVWNSVCVFSFFPQMFTLACEIEWLRQPALHQRTYTAFTVNVIKELWPQTLQTAKLTQTLPVTGQILRSPKQWPKSLVITTVLSEFIYFYFFQVWAQELYWWCEGVEWRHCNGSWRDCWMHADSHWNATHRCALTGFDMHIGNIPPINSPAWKIHAELCLDVTLK